mgnify:CR=1 FL=1
MRCAACGACAECRVAAKRGGREETQGHGEQGGCESWGVLVVCGGGWWVASGEGGGKRRTQQRAVLGAAGSVELVLPHPLHHHIVGVEHRAALLLRVKVRVSQGWGQGQGQG